MSPSGFCPLHEYERAQCSPDECRPAKRELLKASRSLSAYWSARASGIQKRSQEHEWATGFDPKRKIAV